MATAVSTVPALQTRTMSALRYPNFRLYFIGQIISLSGTWMQTVAQGWLVFNLTKEELWLGIVACAAGIPSLVLSPFAGVLVDRFPRRNLLIVSQTVQMILAFILAGLTFAGVVQVWHIVLLAFILGITNAIDAPARQTIIADLVTREDLTSGIALNSIMFNASRVFGPAAAGIALTQVGPAWCFFFNGLSFLAVLAMLLVMRVKTTISRPSTLSPIQRLKEGLAFARQHTTIAPLLLMAATASIFITNLSTLLPAYADHVLHSPKAGYSAVSTAIGIGAVVAGVVMSAAARRFGRGRVVFSMVIFVTITAVIFTRVSSIEAATVFAALYGFGIILQFVTTNTLIQSEVPDEFRGRVMSLYTLTFFGVSPFGALLLGFIASGIGYQGDLVYGVAANGLPMLNTVTATLRGLGTPNAMAVYTLVGGFISLYILLRAPKVRSLA